MKKQYTDKDIDNFFQNFKEMMSPYPSNNILDLVKNVPQFLPSNSFTFKSLKIPAIAIIIIATSAIIYFSLNIQKEKSTTEFIEKIAENHGANNPDKNTLQSKEALPSSGMEEMESKSESIEGDLPPNTEEFKAPFPENANEEEQPDVKPTIYSEVREEKELCQWPADTTMDGEQLILKLTDDQLMNLGFLINEAGIFYANEFNGKETYFHSRWENKSGEMTGIIDFRNSKNKKSNLSHFDFYPVFITDFLYQPIVSRVSEFENFNYKNDTLVPVLIRSELSPNFDYDLIIWFYHTEAFYNQLPKQYQEYSSLFNCVKELKLNGLQRDMVIYEQQSLIEGVIPIRADRGLLEKLGVELKSYYAIEYYEQNEHCNFEIYLSSSSQSVHLNKNLDKDLSKFRLVFISDKNGRQSIKWDCNSKDAKSLYDLTDLLIPVKITAADFPLYVEEDQIFWFKPSEELFEVLTPIIGSQIEDEFQSIKSNMSNGAKTSSTCTYFEVCKSTLKLEEMRIFPNPAKDHLRISFQLIEQESIKGSIVLLNTSATTVKILVSNTDFSIGMNDFKFDLEGIQSGIYILKIATANEFLTRRVIIEK